MIKFVLVTRGRTGSTVVLDSLNNLDRLMALQEPFLSGVSANSTLFPENPRILRYENYLEKSGAWTKMTAKVLKTHILNSYLSILAGEAMQQNNEAFGFKVLSHHLSQHRSLASTLKRQGYRFIYLRRNPVRQVISGMVAVKRGMYNSNEDIGETAPLSLDVKVFSDKLHGELLRTREDILLLRALDVPLIELCYEDFLSNRNAFFLSLLEFLSLPSELPSASDKKIMIKNLKETITNLDELHSIARSMYIMH